MSLSFLWPLSWRLYLAVFLTQIILLQGIHAAAETLPTEPKVPDFSKYYDIELKKKAFFKFLTPHIRVENNWLQKQRTKLLTLLESSQLPPSDRAWFTSLCTKFRVHCNNSLPIKLNALLGKVDILPESMVLMQAANESAWGTSRFARNNLNFFGQQCFKKGCGTVPLRRGKGQKQEVARFTSVRDSVHHYFMNINSFSRYQKMRMIRAQLRKEGKSVTGVALAGGLLPYSERGEFYVREIRQMIRHNQKLIEL